MIPADEKRQPKPAQAKQAGQTSRKRVRPPHWPPGIGSDAELALLVRIEAAELPKPVHQFKFCPTRRWHADMAYPAAMLLIEVDGGAYVAGRHTRGAGFEADCIKQSTAAALGYRVIRVTPRQIKSGEAVRLIAQALGVTP